MLLTSKESDSIILSPLSTYIDTIHLSMIVVSDDNILFFFFSFLQIFEKLKGINMENYIRISCRCFLNELADFCNWNLPWGRHVSSSRWCMKKQWTVKLLCVCVYILLEYSIYFNRSVTIKLVGSKTNGFLFLRENYRYSPDYLNFGTNGIRSNVYGF